MDSERFGNTLHSQLLNFVHAVISVITATDCELHFGIPQTAPHGREFLDPHAQESKCKADRRWPPAD
eukprot:1514106-Amphidinium_carterae.1